jgi:hypothetical protein
MKKYLIAIILLTSSGYAVAQNWYRESFIKNRVLRLQIRDVGSGRINDASTNSLFTIDGKDSIMIDQLGIKTVYEFDAQGRHAQAISYYEGEVDKKHYYNHNLDGTYEIIIDHIAGDYASDTTYHDSRGNKIGYRSGGKLTIIEYTHDSLGNIVKEVTRYSNGDSMVTTRLNTYNTKGQLVKSIKTGPGGFRTEYFYEYDNRGLVTRLLFYYDNNKKKYMDFRSTYTIRK